MLIHSIEVFRFRSNEILIADQIFYAHKPRRSGILKNTSHYFIKYQSALDAMKVDQALLINRYAIMQVNIICTIKIVSHSGYGCQSLWCINVFLK